MYAIQEILGVAGAALIVSNKLASALPATQSESSTTILEGRDDNSTWHTTLEIGSSQVGLSLPRLVFEYGI